MKQKDKELALKEKELVVKREDLENKTKTFTTMLVLEARLKMVEDVEKNRG